MDTVFLSSNYSLDKYQKRCQSCSLYPVVFLIIFFLVQPCQFREPTFDLSLELGQLKNWEHFGLLRLFAGEYWNY